jgi:KUP system potassium uptake protein
VVHTAGQEEGQIYVPMVNWLLMIATVGLVLGFQSSGRLTSAYGIAVSLDMVFTTLLAGMVAIRWGWHPAAVVPLALIALVIDLAFFGANTLKIAEGGWYPLAVASVLFIVMSIWRRGNRRIQADTRDTDETLESAFEKAIGEGLPRVPGTAVFLAADEGAALRRWRHHVALNRVLHEHAVFLTVRTINEPRVGTAERLQIDMFPHGAARVVVRYGYMQSPDIPVALRLCERAGLPIDLDDTIYFVGRTNFLPAARRHVLARLPWMLFAFMARNANRISDYYRLPQDRVMELGQQIEI